MERERKFLVTQQPKGLQRYSHTRIRQGYIAAMNDGRDSGASVRIRNEDGRFTLPPNGVAA